MIAIAGATGFVGRHLAARLHAGGQPLRCLVRDPGRAPSSLPAGAPIVAADVLEIALLDAALSGVHTLVHCAAVTADRKERYPGEYARVNGQGTRNLVEAARRQGVRRIVLVNGLGTRPGRPHSYMRTRWEMAEAVRTSGLGFVALQPSVLFGDGAAFVTAFARLARQLPVMPVLRGRTRLQPLWVEDLVTCLAMAVADPRWDGRSIDLGGPEQIAFAEVIRLIMAAAGVRRPTVPLPMPIARIQARLFTILPDPPLVPATLELFDFDNITELDAVARNFGFQPRGFGEHLREHGLAG
ncbi:MAG TPA: NAD-dependent epimerase/dehydratase family protein [Candidatus Limnocylindrales bacterium]|nr:NAD-dependent epimerase/dehydratase family protein [Candidatus Limnocylindrales bacterium]